MGIRNHRYQEPNTPEFTTYTEATAALQQHIVPPQSKHRKNLLSNAEKEKNFQFQIFLFIYRLYFVFTK